MINKIKLYFLKKWLADYLKTIQNSLLSLSIDLGCAELSEEEFVWRMAKHKEYFRLEKVLIAILTFMESDK